MKSTSEQEVKQDNAWDTWFKYYQDVLQDLGVKLNSDSKILDFGCGAGDTVYYYRKRNFQAFGVDIEDYYMDVEKLCYQENIINPKDPIFYPINMDNYRIPFEDNTFDFVFSDQVMEHVQNLSEALGEIKRVLKPGGYSIHFFPPKHRVIEGHVYVPFAGVFQGYYYLLFWAFFGIRNEYQKGLDFKQVAEINFKYLRTSTNYPSPEEIRNYFSSYFQDVYFVEKVLVKYHPKFPLFLKLMTNMFSIIPFLIRTFLTRAVLVRKT